VRNRFASTALAVVLGSAVLGVGACGGGGSSGGRATAASSAPAAAAAQPSTAGASASASRCHKVPRTTVRLIASHANARTRFNTRAAAAVDSGSGYAVSLLAVAGGTPRMGTWVVDDLRAPEVVTSGNVQALEVTNWPLESLAAETGRQSRICAATKLRTPGPVAP
jgi:hypothetical protein